MEMMKLEDGELPEEADAGKELKKESIREGVNGTGATDQSDMKPSNSHQSVWSRRDSNQKNLKMVNATTQIHLPSW